MGPTLTSPANAASAQRLDLAFAWGAVSPADGYQIQIAADAAFSKVAADQVVASTAMDLATLVGMIGYPLDFGITYYWRVRSFKGQAFGDWSSTRSFTTEVVALGVTPILDHVERAQDLLLQQFKGGIG